VRDVDACIDRGKLIPMARDFQCSCGSVQGSVADTARGTRAICYCRSCRAYARFLGRGDEVLDAAGGTGVVVTLPGALRFRQGKEQLACVRLTEKGPLRWYAACCRSPIGNTPSRARVPYVGLVHTCFEHAGTDLEETFGPVRLTVFVGSATAEPRPRAFGRVRGLMRVAAGMLGALLSGAYRRNPFFNSASAAPIAEPRKLTRAERNALYAEP
jgi:hypothetical protein